MKRAALSSLVIMLATLCFAQNVAINADGTLPNISAMLDVKSASKGILIPRVALTGTADVTTIPSPATSLMVYNTTAAGTGTTAVVAGYYYWNSSAWVRMVSSTTATNTVYKTLIPFASGTAITLTTPPPGNPKQLGIVGFGNSGTISQNGSNMDLTSGPNYAFLVPTAGTITEISGFFSVAPSTVLNSPTIINCQLYFSQGGSNTFIAVPGTLVSFQPTLVGFYSAGFAIGGLLSGLNIPVTAGTRLLMVVSASNSSGMSSSIPGYFSGGVNMLVQ